MPRKRKNLGGSPARKSLNTEDVASSVAHHEEPTALPTVPSQPSVDKEKLLNSLSEMFSDLDPDVVYLMLSECDFKVENAMDCLLELSTGAKGMSASKSLILESVATPLAFVNQHVAEGNEMNEKCPHVEDEDSSQVADAFSDMRLTEDLDSLIQNAFEKLNYASNDQVSTQSLLPLENNFGGPSDSGRSFSLQKTEMGIETFENSSVLSSDHLTLHSDLSKSRNCKKDAVWPLTNSSPMDAQPNSFFTQPNDSLVVYVNPRQTQNALSDAQKFGCQPSQACVRLGTNELRTAVNPIVQISDQTEDGVGTCGDQNGVSVPDLFAQSKAFGFKPQNHAELPPQGSDFSFCPGMPPLPPPPVLPQTSWNPMASAFEPFQGIRSFLAPVAASPQPVIPVFDYCEPGRVCASLPPPVLFGTWDRNASLPMPMAWRNQDGNPYQVQEPPASHTVRRKTPYVGQTLVLLRGLPGSGKSFLARKLLEENPNGIILSSDDYFSKNGQYQFDGNLLGEAHEWNRKRAKEALEKKVSPVIIDNTNLQAWEMKPYIILSQKYKYKIHFREPDTWWKFKPKELARRNIHGVTKEKIARMLEHYERYVSVTHVLDSSVPDRPEHTELSEHSCQEENISLKDSDDYTCLKENDLSSSLKHSEISEEKLKLGTNISSFQENMKCFPIVDLEKGEQEVLPDIFKTTSDTLNEETAIIEYFEGKKNENLTKGDKKFQVPAEGYINEDKPEMEKIVRAKSPINLAGGINDESKIRHCEVDKAEILNSTPTKPKPMNIDCLELALPPELAFQLSELFGPVGIDSGSLTVDDCVVHIDLNLAKVIHEKWKESIMERQRQDEISRVLHTRDTSVVGHSNPDTPEQKSSQRTGKKLKCQNPSEMPLFMDHWNTQTKKVSLREIMSEEIALQEKHDMKQVPLVFEKNCAAKLKEKQLLKMFPTINQNFLMDIFKDNNYCLEQTVQFLNCVLEADPVKTVVAQEFIHQNETASSYNTQKSKEKKTKKSKETEDIPSDPSFQDFEYPKYDDYRAEAVLHQQKRLECYSKAKEAYRMGKKNVATFYAQQGSLHEEKMREANHLAAVEIFEKVNASLLPQNVLDLHGLHVDEAINHLITVLQQKTEEHKQNGGKPYLSVITGRGNHSQGGVARIKPAVIKYLTSHNFRFSEIKPGCLKVILK
uniref:NEDD4-binding protein 2 isoform X4 n=1 Tax=Phascolarctos cinereus TaxID=38626 RepID=A0A6P5KMZ9_PHACI|nr:NEDD4-binding protein 2 isoform X4 [Phascolarctos cinereus]